MEHPHPVLPSQRYSPSPVYSYDSRRCTPTGRQPLRESTGNAQTGSHLGSLASSCRNSPLGLFSPGLTNIPTPPVVPSQAGASYRSSGSLRRPDALHLAARRGRYDINPIYYAPEFRPYRDKQDQKDPNEKQIWPRVLEDAFLDSLLIIPHMGRKKYSMQGKQFGRNMLISEYLWIAYCCSLQPGQKAEERKRKQVSSHIQVVKKMFEKHRCYHFFFVKDPDKSEARLKDNLEMASFKDNPVLIALSEGRLPDVRPNYEYFAQILAMDSLVVMRPKTAWIFVASSGVRIEENGDAYDQNGKLLDHEYYPHLEKNLHKEDGLSRGLNGSVLLHEYNRELAQKESAAVTELSQEWEAKFPPLHKSLEYAIADNKWLDILEMTVTLEIHPRSNFPAGSELNGFVELSISQPALQNHRWKCVTKLARPEELRRGENEPCVVEQTSEVGVQYTHRPGCQDNKFDCDCRSRPRQDVRVPFPAAEWASILSTCAGYLEPVENKTKIEDADERVKAAEEAALEAERTTAELIQQVGMFQELWSAPPDNNADRRVWTRRGIILWKFRTIHAFDDKWNPIFEKPAAQKGKRQADEEGDEHTGSSRGEGGGRPKRVFNPPGTTWRFLTALDPVSQAHQQNVCVSPAAAPSRDMLMAPTPPYSHHLAAVMNDNMSSAWEPVTMPGQLPSLASTGTLGLMDTFSHGLATPPPTASIHSSYASSYDGSHELAGGSHHQLDFLAGTCTTSMDSQSTLVTDMAPTPADPFLSATAGIQVSNGVGVGVYDDADCEGISEWDTAPSFHSLPQWNGNGWSEAASDAKTQQWQNENQRATAANSNLWAGDSSNDHHHHHHHQHQHQAWNQQPWAQAVSAVAAVAGTDGRSGWSPADGLPSLDSISPLKSLTGSRKRARSNSLDMESRENFPATAIQKLVHHRAPAAVMDEGSHGHRSWD